MSLNDLINNMEKQAGQNHAQPSEEQIKEAYAAGRIVGAAFSDEIGKFAAENQGQGTKTNPSPEAKNQGMGVATRERQGQPAKGQTNTENAEDAAVNQVRKALNEDQRREKNNNNNQGAGTAENNQTSDGPQQNQPATNKEESVEAAANEVVSELMQYL